MTQAATRWSLQGEYFENCNCDFLCPCWFAPTGPLTALPTQGHCDAMLAMHVDRWASLSGKQQTGEHRPYGKKSGPSLKA